MEEVWELKEFIESKIDVDYGYGGCSLKNLDLQELIALRELVQMAIVQRLCEYSPTMFTDVFPERKVL